MSDYKVTDSELTGIANAIRTKGGTSSPLVFPNGFTSAIGAIPTGGSGVIQSLSVTQNGTYTPPSGVDGYAPVVVNVSGGGGSTFAFAKVIYTQGNVITATDGQTTLTGDSSGEYVFALPNSGTWTFSDGIISRQYTFSAYGESKLIARKAVLIQTESTSGSNAAMNVSTGFWNGDFVSDGTDTEKILYSTVPEPGKYYLDIIRIAYNINNGWRCYAVADGITDGTNTYFSGDLIKTWGYSMNVDFSVHEI